MMNSSMMGAASALNTTMADDANSKGNNVQVVVRCRPPTDNEKRVGDASVLGCLNGNEVHLLANSKSGKMNGKKVYTFDASYGGMASQADVYTTAVQPLVEEVLAGFNCTVFAYGQTGTGKTYTMEGEMTSDAASQHAGVIPRSVHTIFDQLENQNLEYSVKVSFLELYNEELTDLLADESQGEERELRIFEDASGKRGMLVNNLEEVIVTSASQVFELLQRSWQKRRTAETLLNKNSSRSHCVFIITVHTKECDEDGEDIIKTGKLYLVDLAGSECVGKSGAQNQRAKEAGKINQSLLTLGRVINALVDKAGYIPYRDSKLTRLLQESLGGRAKTVIIATVSPALMALDETVSTLEYAHRAKNIRNRPQVNQKMTKRAYMKDLLAEINSLKRENEALRTKNGIYLPPEKYELLMQQQKGNNLKIEELYFQMKQKETELEEKAQTLTQKEAIIDELQALYTATTNTLNETKELLQSTKELLESTQATLAHTETTLRHTQSQLAAEELVNAENRSIIAEQSETETLLHSQTKELVSVIHTVIDEKSRLHSKIDRKHSVEVSNDRAVKQCNDSVVAKCHSAVNDSQSFAQSHSEAVAAIQSNIDALSNNHSQSTTEARQLNDSHLQALTESFTERAAIESAFVTDSASHNQAFIGAIAASAKDRTQYRQQYQQSFTARSAAMTQSLTDIRTVVNDSERETLEARTQYASSARAMATDTITASNKLAEFSVASLSSSAAHSESLSKMLATFSAQHIAKQQQQRKALTSMIVSMIEEFERQQSESLAQFVSETETNIQMHLQSLTQAQSTVTSQGNDNISVIEQWQTVEQAMLDSENARAKQSNERVNDSINSMEAQQSVSLNAFSEYDDQLSAHEATTAAMVAAQFDANASIDSAFAAAAADNSTALKSLTGDYHSQSQLLLAASEATVSTQCEALKASVSSASSSTDTFVDTVNTSLQSLSNIVTTLVVSEWRTDQPTGQTPEKRKISVRQEFAATAEHETIREQVRQARKVVNPVLDLDEAKESVTVTRESESPKAVAPAPVLVPVAAEKPVSSIPVLAVRTASVPLPRAHSRHRREASSSVELDAHSDSPARDDAANENTPVPVNQPSHIPQPAGVAKAGAKPSALKFRFATSAQLAQ